MYNTFLFFSVRKGTKTKIDSSFSNSQFCLAGYRMFKHDRNSFGGGLYIYVNENIPEKQLNLH